VTLFVFGANLALTQSGFDDKLKSKKSAPTLSKTFKSIDGRNSQKDTKGLVKTFSGTTLHQSTEFKTYKDLASGTVIFIENFRKSINSQST
jgi:hypothetical protein